MRRRIVIVSGAPGSGKTSLAVPLATKLQFPLFSKDFIKETLVDALGDGDGSLESSRRLGGAAMELIWTLAQRSPQAIIEANFRPNSDYEREKLRELESDIVEVYCDCGAAEAARRYNARALQASRNARAHPLKSLNPELLAEFDRPMACGPVIHVNTRTPADVPNIASEIERLWGS